MGFHGLLTLWVIKSERGEEKKKVSQFQTELMSNESWDGMEWKSQADLPRAALKRASKPH